MISIRGATVDDAARMAPLMAELGYPAGPDAIRARLKRLLGKEDGDVLAAELGGELVGLVSYQLVELIYRPRPVCRITALVVRSELRRNGTGTRLVEAVEGIARRRGCLRLELTTRGDQDVALSFYSALGFAERPRRLAKELAEE